MITEQALQWFVFGFTVGIMVGALLNSWFRSQWLKAKLLPVLIRHGFK